MRDTLLALLEDGPHSAHELALWVKADRLEVIRVLKALKAEGLTWRTDRADGTVVWSLAGVSAGGLLQPAPQVKPKKKAAALRQVVDAVTRIDPTTKPSWWVGLSRDDLEREAHTRAESMKTSKQANFVPHRTLQ
jgi:hypothetical protein